MSDEERLRNAMIYGTSHPEIYKTAQDEELERLRAENTKLKEALRPFALIGDVTRDRPEDASYVFPIKMCRTAADVLSEFWDE